VKRVALLANPGSGSGEAERVEDELRELGAQVTAYPLDEWEAAAEVGAERVVVAGGDGSIGCAAAATSRARVPLGVVPVGTANDFARALELPSDLAEACRLAIEGERTQSLELGRMGERPFINVASLGLPPAAARRAKGMKRFLGAAAYALGAVRAGLSAGPVACTVRCDGTELFAGEVWQATVACTGAFGGGADVVADPRDGYLNVVVVEATSRAALVVRAYGLRVGRLESQRGVRSCQAERVEVDVPEGAPYNVDGEVVEAGPSTFTVEANAFEVVVG
jgi:YegS/Rv2252/BmrU family lipid kinase